MAINLTIHDDRRAMLSQLRNMAVGQVLVFPLESRATIRTYCCEYGLEWRRKFESKTDRISRTVSVTRIS